MINQDSHQSKPIHVLLCKFACLDDWFIALYCSELKKDTKKIKISCVNICKNN